MSLAVTVERDIEIEIERRIISERAIYDVVNTRLDQSVRRNDDAIDAVVRDEKIDDVREIATQSRFTAGEP